MKKQAKVKIFAYRPSSDEHEYFTQALKHFNIKQSDLMREIIRHGIKPAIKALSERKQKEAADAKEFEAKNNPFAR